jgi:hypothetical protein
MSVKLTASPQPEVGLGSIYRRIHTMPNTNATPTAAELLAVRILDAALQRAHRAADLATADYPELDVEISITRDVGRLDPTDLVPIHYFVIAAASGAGRGGDLLPVETTATMVRQIRSSVELVIREIAGMEAEAVAEAVANPYETDVELPATVTMTGSQTS